MATIHREIRLAKPAAAVWDAFRDFGAPHERLARGFVTATTLEEGARTVTFANGLVARELLVTMDDAARRLVYAVTGGQLTHHNASFQVFEEGAGSRVVWITDLLPEEGAGPVGAMVDAGCAAMLKTLG
jgi:carbon monoxide dehydrogenase subunit G